MVVDEDGWPMLGASLVPSSRDPRWANPAWRDPSLGIPDPRSTIPDPGGSEIQARCGGGEHGMKCRVDSEQ
jgi:hypothetical protein